MVAPAGSDSMRTAWVSALADRISAPARIASATPRATDLRAPIIRPNPSMIEASGAGRQSTARPGPGGAHQGWAGGRAAVPSGPMTPGHRIRGQYELVEIAGRGGMANVWRAIQLGDVGFRRP